MGEKVISETNENRFEIFANKLNKAFLLEDLDESSRFSLTAGRCDRQKAEDGHFKVSDRERGSPRIC